MSAGIIKNSPQTRIKHFKGFRLWKPVFERQIYKNVRRNHKKQPSNTHKAQEKTCP
nr:MAG TPA: hypothetical protein [Caudoviricetes sp.]